MEMASANTYQSCLNSMYSLRRFGIKMGLSTIRKILTGLGNPQNTYNCIHVAGTNGKGSVASSLASILHQAGYKTGLYTSPHLSRVNERVRINDEEISDTDLFEYIRVIRGIINNHNIRLTYFEFVTVLALYYFNKKKVDYVVLEVGMGGRLDATNVVKPIISVITNVEIEHQNRTMALWLNC